jgi:uncharacterized membrane protein YfcA
VLPSAESPSRTGRYDIAVGAEALDDLRDATDDRHTVAVSATEAVMLVLAGIGGGPTGSIAGLASLISFPALLVVSLSPVTANVTNTVALVCSSAGSVLGSRPELRGQGAKVRQLAIAGTIGGAAGGALLLVTPGGSFELVVPWLIALGSAALLARRRLVESTVGESGHHVGPGVVAAVGVIGVYGGYFGAGAGVMLLALLLYSTDETMPRCNAVNDVVLGLANGIAAVAFIAFGDVRWDVVLPLGAGLFAGGRLGPVVVRRTPVRPLRIGIAVAGLGLAVKLGVDAYR